MTTEKTLQNAVKGIKGLVHKGYVLIPSDKNGDQYTEATNIEIKDNRILIYIK